MSGYTRQSSSDLVPTAVVRSSPLNTEYNKIRDAFAFDATGTTGHKHDGSSDEGSYVPLIADLDALNKVAIDTGNNRVGFFVEVSSAAVEQARLSDGLFAPVTTNDVDLGAVAAKFKDLHLAGDANVGGDLNLTGDLVGNVTGNLTGNVTGNVTGDLSGNVTAASGSSSFTNVTINGTLDVTNTPITNVSDPTSAQEAATKIYVDTTDNLKLNLSGGTMSGAIAMGASKITGLGDPTLAQDAATKAYVDSEVSSLVDAAPGALNTLNELAAAIGDDASFSTTVTNSIAAKLPLSGGTMSGAIEMGTSKITGLGDPTLAQDATTKTYVDTADALKLNLAGGTMSGAIAMGNSKITGLGTPTTGTDATTKTYVDGILGSATDSATSAAAALVSENNAAASYDAFDDRYLGSKASDPAVDNDGDALLTGAIYWNTTDSALKIYDGASWNTAAFDTSGALVAANNLSELTDSDAAITNLGVTATATELNYVSGVTSAIQTQLGTKAPLASPTFTGTPTAPTAAPGTNTTQVATTAFVNIAAGGSVAALTPAATVDIDTSTANYFTMTPNVNTTFTLSNTTAVDSFTLVLTGGGAVSGFELASASYDSVSFSVTSQDGTPNGITFNTDGTKMYMVGSSNNSVYQYTLSTGFDISTASYDSVSFSVNSQDGSPNDLTFNTDGTKMYMVGSTSDDVHQYTLSTGFDLSTASYDSVSFSLNSEDTTPRGIAFNTDGTKMYVVGSNSDDVHQYTLSTGFDLSTASYDSVSFSINSQDGTPYDLAFNTDGTKMYIVGLANDSVYQYTLSTGFDISTASYDSVSFSVTSQDDGPNGITFNTDGTKMYMVGSTSDTVYQYSTSLTTTHSITYPAAFKWSGGTAPDAPAPNEIDVITAFTVDSGTTWYATLKGDAMA